MRVTNPPASIAMNDGTTQYRWQDGKFHPTQEKKAETTPPTRSKGITLKGGDSNSGQSRGVSGSRGPEKSTTGGSDQIHAKTTPDKAPPPDEGSRPQGPTLLKERFDVLYAQATEDKLEKGSFATAAIKVIHEVVADGSGRPGDLWKDGFKDKLLEIYKTSDLYQKGTDAQKKAIETLIVIHERNFEELYHEVVDARSDKKGDQNYQDLASLYILSTKVYYGDLLNIITKEGSHKQVTERFALSLIDQLRKARAKKDTETERKKVTTFLYLLTPSQRRAFGDQLADCFEAQKKKKAAMPDQSPLFALSVGTHDYLASRNKGVDPSKLNGVVQADKEREQAYQTVFKSRSDRARELYDATRAYIAPDGNDFRFNPGEEGANKKQFDEAIAKYKQDGLMSFAMGLANGDGHDNKFQGYGEQLLLALSVADGTGSRILATQNTIKGTEKGDGPMGAIRLAQADQYGRVNRAALQRTLKGWDQEIETGDSKILGHKLARSHAHVYQSGVKDIFGITPGKGKSREFWFVDAKGVLQTHAIINKEGKPEAGDWIAFNKPPVLKSGIDTPKTDYAPESPNGPPKPWDMIFHERGDQANCVGTLVAKKVIDAAKDLCDYAFLTASHCILDRKKYSSNGQAIVRNWTKQGTKLEIKGFGEFAKKDIEIAVGNAETYVGSDHALLKMRSKCGNVTDDQVAVLADTDGKGNPKLVQGDEIGVRKRNSEIKKQIVTREGKREELFNPGGGSIVKGKLTGKQGDGGAWIADLAKKSDVSTREMIQPGDSGAPVFTADNKVIAPLSGYADGFINGNTRERIGGADFVFDPQSTSWAKGKLDEWFGQEDNLLAKSTTEGSPRRSLAGMGFMGSYSYHNKGDAQGNWLYKKLVNLSDHSYWRDDVLHSAHEQQHMANSNATNLARRRAGKVEGPGKLSMAERNRLHAFVDPHTDKTYEMVMPTSVQMADVIRHIPHQFKGKVDKVLNHYNLYVRNSQSGSGKPDSLIDEWLAYESGLEAGFIEANQGKTRIPWGGREDGPIQFLAYNMAFIKAVNEKEPSWWNTTSGQSYKELFATQARRTLKAQAEVGKRWPSTEGSVQLANRLLRGTEPEMVVLRNSTANFMQSIGDSQLASAFKSTPSLDALVDGRKKPGDPHI